MSITHKVSALALCSTLVLTTFSGCAQSQTGQVDPYINKQNTGALLGAATGAILGSNVGKGNGRVAAIATGTLLGAALGSSIGKSLDQADMTYYNSTSQRALETAPTGSTTAWRNPDSGNSGTVTPVRTYQNNGQYCREYTQTIMVGGKKEQGHGVACRQPDGTWSIQQ